MQKLAEFLYLPALAAIASALILQLLQSLQKRRAIRIAILTEVSNIMEDAAENLSYLEKDDHYWLQPGKVINFAPKPFVASTRIFNALLPDLPVLGGLTLQRVVAFYGFHETCENLRASLFSRVSRHVDSGNELSHRDVEVLKKRKHILCLAYKELISSSRPPSSLSFLKTNYNLPQDDALRDALNLTPGTIGDKPSN
jgi:hypothetical protein